MKNTVELAAEFIHHGALVDANALLKDVEYKNPSQVQYYSLFKGHQDSRAINEACCRHDVYRVPRVGEETAVNTVRQVWQAGRKTYTTTLNERVSKASIKKSSGSGLMTTSLVSLRALLPTRGFLD